MRGILSRDSGATDPILIIAGIAITLILLVGGTFAVAGFMNNARDTNAKADLDRVATAQTAAMAASDAYQPLASGPRVREGKMDATLATGGIGFVPSDDNTVVVAVGPHGWAALAESASGASFLRTSESSATIKVNVESIREDFVIEALEGRMVDSGGSAASLGAEQQLVKFPSDVSVYNLAWTWVDTVWGLPADERPAPGAPHPSKNPDTENPGGGTENPGGGGSTNPPVEPEPTPDPEPVIPPFPTEDPLASRLADPFSSDTLDKTEISLVNIVQDSTRSCAYVSYWGVGTAWNIKLDPKHVLYNYDLDPTHYTAGAFLQVERVGDRLVISPKPSMLVYNKLEKGKMYQAQICNIAKPSLPTSQVESSAPTTHKTWKWEKTVNVTTTSAFYLDWKIRVDFTDVVESHGMQPNGFQFMRPGNGAGTVTVTHVGGNVYEFVGVGGGVNVRKDKPVQFVVYPK